MVKYGNTLESSRKDGRLANTDNIYDKRTGEMQEAINQKIINVSPADEEDLTKTIDEEGRSVTKFADRSYSPSTFSGKGYKILRKNIQKVSLAVVNISVNNTPSSDGYVSFNINGIETQVDLVASTDNTTALVAEKIAAKLAETMTEYEVSSNASLVTLTRKIGGEVSSASSFSSTSTGTSCTISDLTKSESRNVLTSNMVNMSNTIYEVRYDFDLNNQTLEIPEGCTIKFSGGSFTNGTIKGNKTKLLNIEQVDFKKCKMFGTWQAEYVRPEWFGAIGDGNHDDSSAIINAIDSTCNVVLRDDAIYGFANISNRLNLNGQKLYSNKTSTFKYLGKWVDNSESFKKNRMVFNFKGNHFEIKNIIFDLGADEWVSRLDNDNNTYMSARLHSHGNTAISNSSYFKVENCIFIGGIHSLDVVYDCAYFIIDNCIFSKNNADSLYVTDGSHNGIVQNCHLYDNGDDGYCINVRDGASVVGHDITIQNCTGTDCQGSLCIASGGNNILFSNVNGNCLRAAPIRVEYVNSETYNGNLGKITISGCSIKSRLSGFFSSNISGDTKYIIPMSVVVENCKFTADSPLTHMIYRADNMVFTNCVFENISLHFYFSENVTLLNNTLISPNNSTCEKCNNIRLLYNKIYNNCATEDLIRDQRNIKDDLNVRRCINIYSSSIVFSGNEYNVNNIEQEKTFYAISFDDYCSELDFAKIDSPLFLQLNNCKQNIYMDGILDITNAKIYNKVCIRNGQLVKTKNDNLIKIINDGQLSTFYPYEDKYQRAASKNEIPSFDVPSNYSNAIYTDNSRNCFFIYNSIKNIWVKLQTAPVYTNANDKNTGWLNSRPKLSDNENDKGYCYFDFNLKIPIWWNGTRWVDARGNNPDANKRGGSADRPQYINIGYIYYDTDLNKFIIWNGTSWVNIDGTSLE